MADVPSFVTGVPDPLPATDVGALVPPPHTEGGGVEAVAAPGDGVSDDGACVPRVYLWIRGSGRHGPAHVCAVSVHAPTPPTPPSHTPQAMTQMSCIIRM
jgi:hypothetical protein